MNFLEIGLSFVEGLALIASPCILPVLPLVLASSVEGGRRRPFGIITGFVLAFTAFAMFSRYLVSALGIDPDIIRDVSLVLLGLFGVVLLSEHLSAQFSRLTQRFASAGTTLTSGAGDGFGSGVAIGLLIGLVWTPCAGPIIAAVLVQIIRQESDLEALFLVASFALGAGLPMLVIALTGRKIMGRLGFFTRHAETVRKLFGVVIVIAVAIIALGIVPTGSAAMPKGQTINSGGLQDALAQPYQAPEFVGLDGWLNSPPLTMEGLKGKVVLIDFWTYSCINCVRTFPYLKQWDEKYRDKGLVIVGVHAPEFEFEKKRDNVAAAIEKYGIAYPVAQDNRLDTWTAYRNRYWPAHYLIDAQGKVVYTHFGEGNYAETENNIRHLLGLDKTSDTLPEKASTRAGQTPETYLGYGRAKGFASPEPMVKDASAVYTPPAELPVNQWALQGAWQVGSEHITATTKGAALQLHFNAGKVFLVLGTKSGKPVTAQLLLDGKPIGTEAGSDVKDGRITVDGHTLYTLVEQDGMRQGVLEIRSDATGLEAYAFTFGG